MKRFIIILICFLLLPGGCKHDNGDSSAHNELVFYCAAGIRPPVSDVITAFESEHDYKIIADYAGSEVLLSKIKLVQKGDLYMPGDKHYIGQAEEAGMIDSSISVFYWVPTILVQKGNPKGISGLKDLLADDLKIGLGDAKACAIGRITQKILEKNGFARDAIEKNLKFQSQTVNELGMQIQAGALDVVIVWDAMARYYSAYGDQVAIPIEQNVVSSVDLGVLKFAKNKAGAEEFVKFITSDKGIAIFEKHNYSTEKPK